MQRADWDQWKINHRQSELGHACFGHVAADFHHLPYFGLPVIFIFLLREEAVICSLQAD